MRLLLDTHAFLWWVFADAKLSRQARTAIADDEQNDIFVSAASAWEIATKFRIGKLADAGSVAHDVAAAVASEGFGELPISVTAVTQQIKPEVYPHVDDEGTIVLAYPHAQDRRRSNQSRTGHLRRSASDP